MFYMNSHYFRSYHRNKIENRKKSKNPKTGKNRKLLNPTKVDNDDSDEERPKSKVEEKLDAIPPPPTDQSGLQEHWEWEDPAQMKIPPTEPDSESIVSRYKGLISYIQEFSANSSYREYQRSYELAYIFTRKRIFYPEFQIFLQTKSSVSFRVSSKAVFVNLI